MKDLLAKKYSKNPLYILALNRPERVDNTLKNNHSINQIRGTSSSLHFA